MNYSSINTEDLPKGMTREEWEAFKKRLNQGYNPAEIETNINHLLTELNHRGIDQIKASLDLEFNNPPNPKVEIQCT